MSKKARASLILASQSMARRKMLENAGLLFSMVPASFDEAFASKQLQDQKIAPSGIALELSKRKALAVAKTQPDAIVIGADQILEFEGKIISKAKNETEAREKLMMLKGKSHKLISAVTVASSEAVLWQNIDEAVLTMRDFDEAFLDAYCARAKTGLTSAVGAYELERHGSWLFSNIKGNHFTVLGLPLVPLLNYLQDYHEYGP